MLSSLQGIYGMFLILAVGLGLAVVMAIVECIYKRCRPLIKQVRCNGVSVCAVWRSSSGLKC